MSNVDPEIRRKALPAKFWSYDARRVLRATTRPDQMDRSWKKFRGHQWK